MITSVRLQNFKAHRDTTVELGRFTVLVGPNGSGKTSVLQALWLLSRLTGLNYGTVLQGDFAPSDLMNRTAKGPLSVAVVGGATSPEPWGMRLEVARRDDEAIHAEVTWAHGEATGRREGEKVQVVPATIRKAFLTQLYHFDASQIAAAAYSAASEPMVRADGTNTAVVLAALKLEQDDVFDRIQQELRQVVPTVERLRIGRAPVNTHDEDGAPAEVMGHKLYIDFRGAPRVPAHAASEGTLVTLALLTVLHSATRPRLLLLDDIDQSLHPRGQIELVEQIKRLLDEMPDLQIVATTHSPYILDRIDRSDIHVFALKNDGSVAHKRLSDHPEAANEVLTSGQIWSLDPEEEWVAEERP